MVGLMVGEMLWLGAKFRQSSNKKGSPEETEVPQGKRVLGKGPLSFSASLNKGGSGVLLFGSLVVHL